MKIFISWSGQKSRAFAEVFKPWLEQVLAGTDVWLSSEDIDKGTIWFTAIIDQLNECHCGIVCITRENYLAPWIHFEAGGMIKGLGKSKVATVLLDIDYGELRQPLNQFNGSRPDRQGMYDLVKSFNKHSEHPIKEHVLERAFEKFWGELETAVHRLFPVAESQATPVPAPPTAQQSPPPQPVKIDAIRSGITSKQKQSKKRVGSEDDRQHGLFESGESK